MSKSKPAKPRNQSTPAATSEAVWFKLYPGKLLAISHHEPDDIKFAKRHRVIALALAMQEKGMDSLADEIMETTAAAMQAASDHARKAAEARWEKERRGRVKAGMPEQCPSICPSNATRKELEDLGDLGDLENEREPKAAGAAALSRDRIANPSWREFESFGIEQGMDPDAVRSCFDYFTASGWVDSKGKPVANWRGKLTSWVTNQKEIPSKPKRIEPKPGASGKEFSSTLNPRVIR